MYLNCTPKRFLLLLQEYIRTLALEPFTEQCQVFKTVRKMPFENIMKTRNMLVTNIISLYRPHPHPKHFLLLLTRIRLFEQPILQSALAFHLRVSKFCCVLKIVSQATHFRLVQIQRVC